MKKILLSGISLLVLLNLPTSAMADEITPINLAFKGYQGHLVEEGIPSHAAFIQAVQLDKVDAENLVKSAIDSGRLSPKKLQDRKYLRQVKAALFKIQRRK